MRKLRKALRIAAAAAVCLAAVSFSRNPYTTVSGYVKFYGNAPFATAGFSADDGKIYALSAAEGSGVSVEDLSALQGKKIELEGLIEKSDGINFGSMQDGTIIVRAYKVLEKN